MKIVYVITNSDLAGAPIHVESLIRAFSRQATVEAIFGEDGQIIEKVKRANVKTHILPRLRSNISPINDLIALFQLIVVLRKIAPDIVHLHSSKAAMVGRVACLILGLPWIYTVHGWGWRGFGKIKSSAIISAEKVLSLSLRGSYIYVCKSVEATARMSLGIRPDRGRVIYNGVTASQCSPEPVGPLRILMAARVCAAKDHETLIRAFDQIIFPSELVLCGEGTATREFRKKVEIWAPRRFADVELLGVRTDVRSLLDSINVFALVSNFEALPLSIIEAMASARATIATDVGGVSELIEHGMTGSLVPRGGVEEIAESINRLSDSKLRSKMGATGRKRYEETFTELKMTNAVWDAYQEMLQR